MTHQLYAAIDGGGTKTAIVVVDELGEEVARHLTTTSNAAVVGHEVAGRTLRSGMARVMEQVGRDAVLRAAWFGLSGSDRPEDQAKLRPHLKGLAEVIRLSNDAQLVLSALPGGLGVAAVSGTGSIAFGRNREGSFARAGGWGHVFSDEGSGYDLARRMFDAFAREIDGRGPSTRLTHRLIDDLALTEPFQLIAWVYAPTTTKGDLARKSRIVVEEADRGDIVARDIIRESALELATSIVAVGRRLGFDDRLALALTGGTLVHVERFREHVLEAVRAEWADVDVHVVADPALTAARSLAHDFSSKAVRA